MKYLMTILGALVTFGAWADNRLELGNANGGHHCHVQWNQANADDEHKISCEVFLIQDGDDGSYSGQANGTFQMDTDLINAPLPDKPVYRKVYKTTCDQGTAGTIQDDNGNAFTSTDCNATISYRGFPTQGHVSVTYKLVIRNATAEQAAAKVKMIGADEVGESIMFREGMGYVERQTDATKELK